MAEDIDWWCCLCKDAQWKRKFRSYAKENWFPFG